jgi:hypothetical protein
MNKYYFTYGTDGQPFVGGWTEVEAPNVNLACAAFRLAHPDKEPGILNCSSAYTEENFLKSCMASPDGNFRKFCHERISFTFTVEPCDPDEPVDFERMKGEST